MAISNNVAQRQLIMEHNVRPISSRCVLKLAKLDFPQHDLVVIGILVLLCANTVELPFPLDRSTLS
jgi:hypothetical protein